MSKQSSDISQKDYKQLTPNNSLSARLQNVDRSRWLIGVAASTAIGYAAWKRRSLTASGFVGALGSGTVITGSGGYVHAASLVAFFISSSALSKLPVKPKQRSSASIVVKDSVRDVWQVGANGGIPTILASTGSNSARSLAAIGSIAAVTGDTWATELGSRANADPRHILTLRKVPVGASGGVTIHGLIASAGGGAFIGLTAAMVDRLESGERGNARKIALTGLIAGISGSMIDSFVGATLQERRWCDACRAETERTIHTCGQPTRITQGIPGLTNDGVNLICSLAGAITGWGISRFMRH
jgi:uncharacterized protein (TIGR00297 family)